LIRPTPIFLCVGLFTLLLLVPLRNSRVDNTAEAWLPTSSPALISLKDFQAKFGDGSLLLARVEGSALAQQLPEWQRLTSRLRDLPEVEAVYPPRFVEESTSDPGPPPPITAYLSSPDLRHAAILILPRTALSVERQRSLLDQVTAILSGSPLGAFGLAGTIVITNDLDIGSRQSLSTIGPIVALAMCLVLYWATREWRGVLAAIAVITCSSVWAMGLLAWFDRPLNLVVSTIPAILAVVTVTQAMHILAFFHSFPVELAPAAAWRQALRGILRPSVLCTITTSAGFAALATSEIPPVRDLGIFTAIGVLSTSILCFTLFPALLSLSSKVAPRGPSAQKFWTLDRASRYTAWLGRHRTAIILITTVASIAALVGMSKIRIESHILEFFPASHRVPANYHSIEDRLMGMTPIDIVFSGPRKILLSDKALNEYRDFFTTTLKTEPLARQVVSILLEPTREATQEFVLSPAELREAFTEEELPALAKRFLLVEGDRITLRTTILTTTSSSNAVFELIERLQKRLANHSLGSAVSGEVAGPIPLFIEGQVLLLRTQIESFAIALTITALVVLLGFRSWWVATIALAPNAIPISMTLGFMGWTNIALNTATVTVAGIALGLIIDDTIHFLYRYRLARAQMETPQAIAFALFTMGKAAVISSGAVTGGFALFALSPFRPTAYFGLLIAITAATALACDLLLLPAVLMRSKASVPPPHNPAPQRNPL